MSTSSKRMSSGQMLLGFSLLLSLACMLLVMWRISVKLSNQKIGIALASGLDSDIPYLLQSICALLVVMSSLATMNVYVIYLFWFNKASFPSVFRFQSVLCAVASLIFVWLFSSQSDLPDEPRIQLQILTGAAVFQALVGFWYLAVSTHCKTVFCKP